MLWYSIYFKRAQIIKGKDRPEHLGTNLNLDIGRIIGLMICMYEPLFLYGQICCDGKWFLCYKWDCCTCGKGNVCHSFHQEVPLLDKKCSRGSHRTAFSDKEVGDVDMLEDSTGGGKIFHILCFKETDYVMNIMALWMTLDELEGGNKKHNYKGRDSEFLVKNFKYWQPFGLHFRYHHQVDNHNNRCHYPILLERTRNTKFWTDRNFAW